MFGKSKKIDEKLSNLRMGVLALDANMNELDGRNRHLVATLERIARSKKTDRMSNSELLKELAKAIKVDSNLDHDQRGK